MAERKREWQVFLENRDAMIEALKRGECDGILSAPEALWTAPGSATRMTMAAG
jgi:hypothetical protein